MSNSSANDEDNAAEHLEDVRIELGLSEEMAAEALKMYNRVKFKFTLEVCTIVHSFVVCMFTDFSLPRASKRFGCASLSTWPSTLDRWKASGFRLPEFCEPLR